MPTDLEFAYKQLLATQAAVLPDDSIVERIGTLIDIAEDLDRDEGVARALDWCDIADARTLPDSNSALLQYFRANAWAVRQGKVTRNPSTTWKWEQPYIEKQIFHLRACIGHPGFPVLPDLRRCQVLTNLGNSLSTVGRFVESLEYWGRALQIRPRFAMALGNRGYGLERYAHSLYDHGHQALFLKFAHVEVTSATEPDAEYEGTYAGAKDFFRTLKAKIERAVPRLNEINLHPHSMGSSEAERRYRTWCLRRRLFLNPLNDLGEHSVANNDVLMMPTFSTPVGEPPILIGFFNEIKQEFASGRWLLFDGIESAYVHFSDKGVRLYNTLDYPCYSLGVEKVKAAFRLAYSIFDKVAFFLNEYMHLGIKTTDVYFKTLWFKNRSSKPFPIRDEFQNLDNWPFRGLFWLSKDLFDDKLADVIEPDARDFYAIRNRLEHSYLKVQDEMLGSLAPGKDDFRFDQLAYVITRDELESTLRLFTLVRAALIYLMLGMHREERRRLQGQDRSKSMPMNLSLWDDEWKH